MSLVQYDNSIPKTKKEKKTELTIAKDVKNNCRNIFWLTRDQKIESLNGFDDRNEPTFRKFPNCEHEFIKNKNGELVGNIGNYSIAIPNSDPIIEIKMLKFPNCEHCNANDFCLLFEEII